MPMKIKLPVSLWVDLDGVLADFDLYCEQCFGFNPKRDQPDPPNFWRNIEDHGSFYAQLPEMPGAKHLWVNLMHLHGTPTILSGVPASVPGVMVQKRFWVRRFDPAARLELCLSKDKYKFCRPGDILVDDWNKYRHLWEGAGGRFVLHKSADESIAAVKALLEEDQR